MLIELNMLSPKFQRIEYAVPEIPDDDSPAQLGAFEKIKQCLLARKRPMSGIIIAIVVPASLIGMSIVSIPSAFISSVHWLKTVSVCVFIFAVCLTWRGWQIHMKRYAIISLSSRELHKSFFIRNKDNVILAVIAAILGVAGTLATQWLLKLFSP